MASEYEIFEPLDNIWVWVNGKKRRGHYNEPWYIKDICTGQTTTSGHLVTIYSGRKNRIWTLFAAAPGTVVKVRAYKRKVRA